MTKEQLILQLHDIGAIKFGNFTLKSGKQSPFYFDLRDMVSYPELVKGVTQLFVKDCVTSTFDYISGVPYTALPFATMLSDTLQKPLLYARKEEKSYGTKNTIIGKYEPEKKCLLLDDLITTGESIFETVEKFDKAQLRITDVMVIIDRSKNATQLLRSKGLTLHALIDLDKILQVLQQHNRISLEQVQDIQVFTNGLDDSESNIIMHNPLTKKLLDTIKSKQSNLVLSLDVTTQQEFFNLLEQTAEHIVMLKTHIDILDDFDDPFIPKLLHYAQQFDFLIFEDRKFADIGNTVKHQYENGVYQIKTWADFVTVHSVPGEGILQGLFEETTGKSSFLLAKMSSKGNLMNDTYVRNTFEMGRKFDNVVSGYICHATELEDLKRLKSKIPKGQLMLTPGVNLQSGTDAKGQQYITVEQALQAGSDCIIVGRDIIQDKNPKAKAQMYQNQYKDFLTKVKVSNY